MSISDTSNARKYASIAEVAAASAKLSAEKLEQAPDYASQAAASAAAAASSAQVAVSAESVVNSLAISASESATQAAASAADAGNAASAAVGQCVRVPDGELIDELPPSGERQNTVVSFVDDGSLFAKPLSDFATLDENGKIPVSQIPSIALTEPFVVSSQAEMLALDAQVGDIAKRTDLGYSFCLAASPASSLSNWIQLTDDVLSQLGQSSGAGMIGALDESGSSSTVQLELNKRPTLTKLAQATSAALIGTSSGGNVQSDLNLKASISYVDTQISGLVTKASLQGNVVFATADAGIANDGSDVSTQVSTFLNANKGKFIVFDSGTYMFAGVVLSGTGWEGTTIYFKGKHLLKPDTTGTNTPGYGGFIGLILTKTVNDLTLYYRGDGNRTLQYNREHIFNVAIYGSTNLSIPYFKCDEIRGDGLYINSEDQTSSSAQNATNINIGIVLGRNSSIDGRNLISIVSCNRGNIKSFISENIGGVVGGFQQPGGLDVEPNNLPGCLVRDFVIEYASSIGAGGVYLVTDWTANPKKIQNCHVLKALVRNGQKIRMYGTDQSSINGECISSGIDSSVAAEGNTNGSMTVRVINCVTVALLGTQSTNYDCKFTFYGRKISNAGVITGGQYRCDMDLDFDDWIAGGNMIGLWFRDLNNVGSLVQNGNRIKLRCPKTTNISRAIQYTPGTSAITFSGDNVLYDSIFTDWPTFDVILGAAGQYLTKEGKMPFLTTANGVPSNGTWRQGDFVYYANPSTTNKFYGFYRITTGSGNVNGTDWGTVVFS
ncbi:hypothetical protein L8Q54_15625 [Enterobacter kobei]|uniref:hypothetical protein n=2 Tax=Enterobacter cloacae complex TaxID=354276 RepID=UPI002004FA63|nr:hypothetical protein [Enterobacter kobei]MCK6919695.1 hypothetical protein [Enterobacter kobei]